MKYRLVTAKSPLVLGILVGIVFLFINNGESGATVFFSFLLLIIGLIGFKARTEFVISQDELNYILSIFGFILFHKKLSSSDIDQISFKRFGWFTKGAILKLHKGINVRIVQFIPKDVMFQLENFAINNDVSIIKSKDYLLLERREKY